MIVSKRIALNKKLLALTAFAETKLWFQRMRVTILCLLLPVGLGLNSYSKVPDHVLTTGFYPFHTLAPLTSVTPCLAGRDMRCKVM